MPKRNRHRRGEVQHVNCAPAPHLTVNEFATKRVAAPTIRAHRHHIGMSHQAETRSIWVAAFDAGNHRPPAGGCVVDLDIETRPFNEIHQRVSVTFFLP